MEEIEEFAKKVWAANLSLPKHGLVILTQGNVSGRRYCGAVVIKPSGVPYEQLECSDMSVLDLKGNMLPGPNGRKPSTDTPTHLEIYKRCPWINAIVHTHSKYATIFAQREQPIPCLGTTHADDFNGAIPVTRALEQEEVVKDYEKNVGKIVSELLKEDMPAVLVRNHGVFTVGKNLDEAVTKAVVLEEVAFMALHCPDAPEIPPYLREFHYNRKHGATAYYGQKP